MMIFPHGTYSPKPNSLSFAIAITITANTSKTAILINVARGPVVNAKDLADALNNEVIAGAGIDVFDCEPPLPEDEPLLHCKNILLTPHIAFASEQSMSLRAEIVFDNLAAWMEGRQQNVIL